MSGWEKYVEQAARFLDPAAYDERDPHHTGLTMDFRRQVACNRVRRILAAVGPLIAEDARERMVAAAGKALELEGLDASHQPEGLYYCATAGEIEQYPGGGFDVCCELGPAGHEPISEVAFRAVRRQAATEVAAAITKAGEERSPDRHHRDEEKRDHGSTRYASYLDAARIAREAAP